MGLLNWLRSLRLAWRLRNAERWDEETLHLYYVWGETEEDRAAKREFFEAERNAVAAAKRAVEISMTETVSIRPFSVDWAEAA